MCESESIELQLGVLLSDCTNKIMDWVINCLFKTTTINKALGSKLRVDDALITLIPLMAGNLNRVMGETRNGFTATSRMVSSNRETHANINDRSHIKLSLRGLVSTREELLFAVAVAGP